MESLEDKLLRLKELLEKGMSNSGIGGKGAIKAGFSLPSLKPPSMPKPSNTSKAGKIGIPGTTTPTKTNPIKAAEQIHNKSLKDKKMKEAQGSMKPIEMIKTDANGQWSLDKADLYNIHVKGHPITPTSHINSEPLSLKDINEKHGGVKHLEANGHLLHKPILPEIPKVKKSLSEKFEDVLELLDKSGYKGYTPEDNARRKYKNIGETTGIHSLDAIKQYGGSGPSAAAREAKEMKAKSKKSPVKVYSPEEIAEMNKPVEKTEGRTTAVPGVSDMGIEVRRSNPSSKEYSKVASPEKHAQVAKEIAKENIKSTKKIKPILPE